MEIVDPASGPTQVDGVGVLNPPVTNPVAVRLATGKFLVAGGTTPPVARRPRGCSGRLPRRGLARTWRTQFIAPGAVTLAALPAGGALGSSRAVEERHVGHRLRGGPDGRGPERRRAERTRGSSTARAGAPVRWTGDRVAEMATVPRDPHDAVHSDPTAPDVGDPTCSPDPGLAMWLDPAGKQLTTLRFDTRNAYSSLQPGGALDFGTDTAPDGIASAGVSQLRRRDQRAHARVLEPAPASSSPIAPTPTSRSCMSLPTSQAPVVVLRDEMGNEVTTEDCPGLAQQAGHATNLDIERSGGPDVRARQRHAHGLHLGPGAGHTRLPFGLRAGSSQAVVGRMLAIRRGSP